MQKSTPKEIKKCSTIFLHNFPRISSTLTDLRKLKCRWCKKSAFDLLREESK